MLWSLSLHLEMVHSDFIRVKYHNDQANDKDYSHEDFGFISKKWQADQVAKHMNNKETGAFKADVGDGKETPEKYSDRRVQAPEKYFWGQ